MAAYSASVAALPEAPSCATHDSPSHAAAKSSSSRLAHPLAAATAATPAPELSQLDTRRNIALPCSAAGPAATAAASSQAGTGRPSCAAASTASAHASALARSAAVESPALSCWLSEAAGVARSPLIPRLSTPSFSSSSSPWPDASKSCSRACCTASLTAVPGASHRALHASKVALLRLPASARSSALAPGTRPWDHSRASAPWPERRNTRSAALAPTHSAGTS
mmetsp:Transcript_25855/g.97374  ORF Transcript_25855/g.97374 Transcript_25855/m.97374 type:complete len:224 (-) Transcript_25855:272-943(-)